MSEEVSYILEESTATKKGSQFITSSFHHKVDENCALLVYYAVVILYQHFGTTYRSHLQGSRLQEEFFLD
jgi:hypothetical protein